MKVTILTLFLFLFCSFSLLAQNTYTIKGTVTDTASKARLLNSSIVVLNAKDSTLRTFTRAGANGVFTINGLNKGKFILLVTYPEYADYVENFTLDSVKREHNFGNINMSLKSKLLADVIIKGEKAAIKIKGDTTEYNASSFKLQPNAKVEDLLKQLPGITVDKDGKITAQGQTVNKVLVDGEEFFGDDPTLVTKNIRQDMVDKVQLYDKKSDQATFTGIDDGEKTKTINIKLKEDKKNGYFGKAEAGIGTDDYYQTQLMFNAFKGKKKFSAYGILANTGKTGLGWEDSNKYGTGNNNMEFTSDGGIMIFGGGQDDLESFDGRYNGNGIPIARTGGLHYDNKWDSDKKSLNTNYKIGSLGVKGTQNTLKQYNTNDGVFFSNSDQGTDNNIFRQKLDFTYNVKLDTTSNLKVMVDGTVKNTENISDFNEAVKRGNGVLQNESIRNLQNKGDQKLFNASAFYTKKLKKVGRTLSVNLAGSMNQSDADGTLLSNINYYNKQGALDSARHIDQKKVNDIKNTTLNSSITYTEPLSKTLSMVVSYGLNLNNGSALRNTFDKVGGQYTNFNDSLSSDYSLNQLANQGGLNFNYKKGKGILNFGTKISSVNFKQIDEYRDTTLKRDFINWNPQASYQYRFSQQSSMRINYWGNTRQPTIDQIQPVRNNNDPLNQIVGNPDLDPSFNSSISASYNSYKIISGQSIWLYGSYSFVSNPIVNNTFRDTSGKTTYRYSNIKDHTPTNFYLSASFDRKIKKLDFNVGLNLSAQGNNSYNYVNEVLNKSVSATYSANLRVSKYKQKKFEFWASAGPNYTISKTSLQKINNNGYGFNGDGGLNVYLPGKVQISTDTRYEYRAATESFDEDFRRTTLNANISKAFFKQENLKLVLSGFDLLNQNRGFNRSAYEGQITQTTYTNIRRYFMFSIVYDFNKMGGGAPAAK